MSKTRAELINQCLINLGVYAYGQSVSAEDVQKMDAIVNPAVAELAALEIYYVDDAGDAGPSGGVLDDAAFLSISDYVSNCAASAFNLAMDAKLQAKSSLAEAKLITLSAPARTKKTLRVDPALRSRRRYFSVNDFTNG